MMDHTAYPSLPHLAWLVLVGLNFTIQMLYFRQERPLLFLAKRITTPALLLGGFLVILLTSATIPLLPALVLIVMGLGELGIEGSRIVESDDDNTGSAGAAPWMVTAAGILFLLVNVGLGVSLLPDYARGTAGILSAAAGAVIVVAIVLLFIRLYSPEPGVRFQASVYAGGLAILAAGAGAWLAAALSGTPSGAAANPIGMAALVLAVSDSLVLWRMVAGWSKSRPKERRILLVFLVLILLLYYLYIGVLISAGSPFRPA